MKTKQKYTRFLATATLGIVLASQGVYAQTTGFNKTTGTHDYNLADNWVGGNINGIWDRSLTLTGNQNVTFGADTPLTTGLDFQYSGNFNIVFRGTGADRILTLGGDILFAPASGNKNVTFGSTSPNQGLAVELGGVTRTMNVRTGHLINFVNELSDGGLNIIGGGRVHLNYHTSALTGVALVGSELGVLGASNTGVNTTLTLSGALGVGGVPNSQTNGDSSIITLTTASGRNTQIAADSFSRTAGSAVLFRGTALGTANFADSTADTSNIHFTTAPTLNQAGSGTTIGIIAGAYGSTASNGTGFGATGGLVTYDTDKGVRLLDSAEYTASITSGQTASDNVRYTAPTTTTLTHATTAINSLSFAATGAAGSQAITVAGDASTSLKLNSGMIYADFNSISGTLASGDSITISVPTLDLNGQEGVVLVSTGGTTSQGLHPARLHINSAITNGSLTKSGLGTMQLGGSDSNAYTDVTTVNAGVLLLNKTGGATAIAGNVVVNGGSLYQLSDQIADTSNVTVNGGQWRLGASNSGATARGETVATLTINGGSVYGGQGTASTATLFVTGAVAVSDTGQILGASGYNFTFGSLAVGSGGTVTQVAANNVTGGIMTVNGALTLAHADSGAYTPLTLLAGTSKGGTLILGGDVTSTGNATNTNTMTIDAAAGTTLGTIDLNAATRTFNIGNGVADVDLTIVPSIQNGALTKTGLGTLALGGVNTYVGDTNVNAGVFVLNDTGELRFEIGASEINNGIFGNGAAEFDGKFRFDLAAAGTTVGDFWQIVDVSTLAETFGGTFSVSSTVGDFAPSGSTWTITENTATYAFSQDTGLLTVIPEPSTLILFGIALGSLLAFRRRKR